MVDVLLVDGTEGAKAEGVGGADLARVDGEAVFIAVVVNLLEVPVGHFGIEHRDNEARLELVADGLLIFGNIQACLGQALWNPCIFACPHLFFSSGIWYI